MPTARELLDQADALMRRNRTPQVDDIPVLTDVAHTVPEARVLRGRGAQVRAPAPALPREADEGDSLVSPDADDSIVTPDADDSIVAPDGDSIVTPDADDSIPTLTEQVVAPFPAGVAPEVVDIDDADFTDGLLAPSDDVGVSDPVPDTWLGVAEVDEPALADDATFDAEVVPEAAPIAAAPIEPTFEPAIDAMIEAPIESIVVPAIEPTFEPALASITPEVTSRSDPVVEFASGSPIAPETVPAAASRDDAYWQGVAEDVRMQVLQRIDIFTDTGLREQLAVRLQPIVDRASADLVATINQHVGDLLRAYVAEAIEREIDSWRRSH